MFNAAINGFDLIPITIPNPNTLYSCACLIKNDTVIITGGKRNGAAMYDVYAYHITSGTWTMESCKYTIDPGDGENGEYSGVIWMPMKECFFQQLLVLSKGIDVGQPRPVMGLR